MGKGQPKNPPGVQKRRLLENSIYSEKGTDGFHRIACTCNKFRATPVGNASWCNHVAAFLGTHQDVLERQGFSNSGIEQAVAVTLRHDAPYMEALCFVDEPNSHGWRRVKLSSTTPDSAVSYKLGFLHNSQGREGLKPMIRDWLMEWWPEMVDRGCTGPAHSDAPFEKAQYVSRLTPEMWADIMDLACYVMCRKCRLLQEASVPEF